MTDTLDAIDETTTKAPAKTVAERVAEELEAIRDRKARAARVQPKSYRQTGSGGRKSQVHPAAKPAPRPTETAYIASEVAERVEQFQAKYAGRLEELPESIIENLYVPHVGAGFKELDRIMGAIAAASAYFGTAPGTDKTPGRSGYRKPGTRRPRNRRTIYNPALAAPRAGTVDWDKQASIPTGDGNEQTSVIPDRGSPVPGKKDAKNKK